MASLEGAKVALSKDLKALEAKEDELEEDAKKLNANPEEFEASSHLCWWSNGLAYSGVHTHHITVWL